MLVNEGTIYLKNGNIIKLGNAVLSPDNSTVLKLPNGWAKLLRIEGDKKYIELYLQDSIGSIPTITGELYMILEGDSEIESYEGSADIKIGVEA